MEEKKFQKVVSKALLHVMDGIEKGYLDDEEMRHDGTEIRESLREIIEED